MAIEEIKKAIELKPNYIDAVFLLSQIQVEKGQINEAIQSIQSGIQVDPSNPNLRFQLGLLYYNQEKFNDASALFEDAIRYSPAFANAQYFLGLSYYKNNRTLDAISVFENLNSQIPNNSEIQLILNNMKGGQDPFYGAQPPLDTAPEEREELPLEDSEVEAVSENQ
jgi:tetratricopeptide (TPR) repeat protein